MASFTDNAGREWVVKISVNEIARLRDRLQFNIIDRFDLKQGEPRDLLHELHDPVLLVNVIYVICLPQCEALGVSDEQFGESLVGDAIEDATTALLEALVDFFPKKDREILRACLDMERARRLSGVLDMVLSHFGGCASSLPESPELTPAGSHSAN